MDKVVNSLPRIFVSHSVKDNEFGAKLVSDLQRAIGDNDAVWYDVSGLQGGDEWWDKIVEELTTRDVFIVVLSPNSVVSRWVLRELNTAINEGKRIVPVLYQPCKVRADLKTIQMISFLSPKYYETAFNELCTALGLPGQPIEAVSPPGQPVVSTEHIMSPSQLSPPTVKAFPASPALQQEYAPAPPQQPYVPRGWLRIVLIAAASLVVLGGVGVGAFYLLQPQAHTPGPNGTPPVNTIFTIIATVQRQDEVTGKQLDPWHETLILTGHPDGGSVCQSRDDGQPYTGVNIFGSTSIYAETVVFKCSGTYKGGKLSYIETVTSIRFTISGGITCESNSPFEWEHLEGTISNQNTISGTFSSDAASVLCSAGSSINANAQTGTWTGTLIQGKSTIVSVRFNPLVVDQQPWWKRLFGT